MTESALPFKDRSAGFLANHLARLFHQALAGRVRDLGLAPAQFMVLLELWGEAGLTQSQLIERLDVEQATMANTLARMERDGLIERRPAPDDRRARTVWPTERARSLETPAKAAAEAVNAAALEALSASERGQLMALMRRVRVSLAAAREGGARP